MLGNRRGQWSLIEIVVVIALIAIVASLIYPRMLGKTNTSKANESLGSGGQTPMTVKERAETPGCDNNLRQIRAAIASYQASNDAFPPSFAELKGEGVIDEIARCPLSHQLYSYDPATGTVWCTTPGHEKY